MWSWWGIDASESCEARSQLTEESWVWVNIKDRWDPLTFPQFSVLTYQIPFYHCAMSVLSLVLVVTERRWCSINAGATHNFEKNLLRAGTQVTLFDLSWDWGWWRNGHNLIRAWRSNFHDLLSYLFFAYIRRFVSSVPPLWWPWCVYLLTFIRHIGCIIFCMLPNREPRQVSPDGVDG